MAVRGRRSPTTADGLAGPSYKTSDFTRPRSKSLSDASESREHAPDLTLCTCDKNVNTSPKRFVLIREIGGRRTRSSWLRQSQQISIVPIYQLGAQRREGIS